MPTTNSPLRSVTKDALKKLARDRGLSVSGNKQDLVRRLESHSPTPAGADTGPMAGHPPADPPTAAQLPGPPARAAKVAEERGSAVVEQAQALEIQSRADMESAAEFRDEVQGLIRTIKREIKAVKDPLNAARQRLLDFEKHCVGPFEQAVQVLKRKMNAWAVQEEIRRREAAEAAEREAARQATEDSICAAAELLEDGQVGQAQEILDELSGGPTTLAPPPVDTRPKADRVQVLKLPRYRVVDESKICRAYMTPDHKAIQREVQEHQKDAEKMVGGIEFFWDTRTAVR